MKKRELLISTQNSLKNKLRKLPFFDMSNSEAKEMELNKMLTLVAEKYNEAVSNASTDGVEEWKGKYDSLRAEHITLQEKLETDTGKPMRRSY